MGHDFGYAESGPEEPGMAVPNLSPEFVTDVHASFRGKRGKRFSGGRETVCEMIFTAQHGGHRDQAENFLVFGLPV